GRRWRRGRRRLRRGGRRRGRGGGSCRRGGRRAARRCGWTRRGRRPGRGRRARGRRRPGGRLPAGGRNRTDDAGGAEELAPPDRVDGDRLPERGRVHHLAAADVHRDVVDLARVVPVGAEEEQVAGEQLADQDGRAGVVLV